MNKAGSGPDPREHAESLSATGMFLRSLGESRKPDPAPADPLKASPAEVPAQPGAQRPVTPTPAGGEFTQLFQTLEPRQSTTPAPPASAARVPSQAPSEQPADRAPGEFTR